MRRTSCATASPSWTTGGSSHWTRPEAEGIDPRKNVLEISLSAVPPGWLETVKALPDVAEVKADDNVFRISSTTGPGPRWN